MKSNPKHILAGPWTRLSADVERVFFRIERENRWLAAGINGCIAGAAIGSALAFIIYDRDAKSLLLLLLAILGLLTIVKVLAYIYLEDLEFRHFGKEFHREYYGKELTVTVMGGDSDD